MPDLSICSMEEDLQTIEYPLPKVEDGTEVGEETMEDIKETEELQQDRMSHHCYRHITDTNLCLMKILQTTEEPQTQPQNKQISQHKGNEMHRSDIRRYQMNGIMRHGTSNHHKNIIMTESLCREEQQRTLRIEENKEPM